LVLAMIGYPCFAHFGGMVVLLLIKVLVLDR